MKRLMIIAAVVGLIVLISKKQASQRQEWQGLTEDEARERIGGKFPSRMPDEAKAAVTEKIVDKMRDKGAIIDLTDDASSDDTDAANTESAEEATTA